MPNWCDYSIEIKGEPEHIAALHQIFSIPEDEQEESYDSMKEYDISRIHPIPEDLKIRSGYIPEDDPEYPAWVAQQEANKAKYGHADWYWWCVANWGTKWSPSISDYNVDDTSITVSGMSAWSPPDGIARHITEKYPVKVLVRYDEGGMCFAGVDSFANGECVYNGYFDYSNITPEDDEPEDSMSDEWYEWYEAARDKVHNLVDAQESIAAMAVDW